MRVLADDDLAVENTMSLIAQNALIQFVAGAMRLGVINQREVVQVLLAPRQVQAVDRGLDRKSTRLNSSHIQKSRMPSSA